MTELRKAYSYLGNLEKRIRIALTFFVLTLFVGSFIAGVGLDRISHFTQSTRPELLAVIGAAAIATILTLVYMLSRIGWIEELHIKIDRYFFGFLKRTNSTIFESLLYALNPADRKKVSTLSPDRQGSLVQSVFSALSSDPILFQEFLGTNIFRNWTLYWISVYGTLAFSILTVVSFVFAALALDPQAKVVFTVCWLIALLQLAIVLMLGRKLVSISKFLVDSMVKSHGDLIAETIRAGLTGEDEVEEADIISED